MWPFIVAGGVTLYLVSKAQDAAVRCESQSVVVRNYHSVECAAEGFKNDPRNPYRDQIAKEEVQH